MNTTSSPVLDLAVDRDLTARTARTSWPDRLAMRLGLWLLLWSSRPSPPQVSAADVDATLARANARARRERESAWLAQRRLSHMM